ncbi:hypothetical protein [Nocardiopsis sp. CNT312]|uniref:hypothetical protein n=1 Tax=Nocardiopsis sp. CNT312 TaxID=1137268 RepID=UPI00048AC9F5|nr:hypothetical protein [Nocardiopsis sp. CNT312]
MTQRTVATDARGSAPEQASQPRFHKPNEDLAAAMECERCAEMGISTPPGWADRRKLANSRERKRKDREYLRRRREGPKLKPNRPPSHLNGHQASLLHRVWAYLAERPVGRDPDSRLLALTCALRGAVKGHANLTGQDLRSLRLEDPRSALTALTSSGWLDTTPEAVIDSDSQNVARCGLPDLEGNPWDTSNGIRSRASGWVSRGLSHKKFRKKPNRLRLTGVYLAARADTRGEISVPVEGVVSACALTGGADEVAELVAWLVRLDWIEEPAAGAAEVRTRLTELTGPMSLAPFPPRTPPRDAPATTDPDLPVGERADALLSGREAEVARWVADYRCEHGHGPSWSALSAHFGWPARQAPDHEVSQEVFARLREGGWLVGMGVPFGLRPGPTAS